MSQEKRLAEIAEKVERSRKMTENMADRVLLYDLLMEARETAKAWRDSTMSYKYGNQTFHDDFKLSDGEKLPWEKSK